MPEFPISTLAAVVEHMPVPVVLTTQEGAVVASSRSSHAIVGDFDVGVRLDELLSHLHPIPSTVHHDMSVDGQSHVLVTIDDRPSPPSDVAELARATAHDFNNLLGVIINFASLAAAQIPEGNGALQDLQEVLVASRRAATLTQRLLQIATAAPEPSRE
jgi:signal transduction histidine kinase